MLIFSRCQWTKSCLLCTFWTVLWRISARSILDTFLPACPRLDSFLLINVYWMSFSVHCCMIAHELWYHVYDLSFCSFGVQVFCNTYSQVHPNMQRSMRHLFGTWATVFPPPVLHKIEMQLEFSPSTRGQPSTMNSPRDSESPRPLHGIHINPKYLEAKHQFGRSTVDTVRLHSKL